MMMIMVMVMVMVMVTVMVMVMVMMVMMMLTMVLQGVSSETELRGVRLTWRQTLTATTRATPVVSLVNLTVSASQVPVSHLRCILLSFLVHIYSMLTVDIFTASHSKI